MIVYGQANMLNVGQRGLNYDEHVTRPRHWMVPEPDRETWRMTSDKFKPAPLEYMMALLNSE